MLSKRILFLSIIFLSSIYCFAQNAWGKEVFLNIQEKPLRYVLNEIRSQSQLNLIFNDNLIAESIISCNFKSTAEEAISEVLSKNGFSFKKFENNSAVIFKSSPPPTKVKAVVRRSTLAPTAPPISSEILKPTLISNIKLNYPIEAIAKKIEGEVLTRILVTSKGDVEEVEVERSSGHNILDTATINHVRKLKFLPAEFDGKYHKVWTTMLVKYSFE